MDGQQKKIRVTIDKSGKVNTEAIGFIGGACAGPLAKITSAFGGAQTSTDKPEFAMLETQQSQQMMA